MSLILCWEEVDCLMLSSADHLKIFFTQEK